MAVIPIDLFRFINFSNCMLYTLIVLFQLRCENQRIRLYKLDEQKIILLK